MVSLVVLGAVRCIVLDLVGSLFIILCPYGYYHGPIGVYYYIGPIGLYYIGPIGVYDILDL